jgi:hypothetical protein
MAPTGFSSRGTDFRTHGIDSYFYEPKMKTYGKRKRPSKKTFKTWKKTKTSTYRPSRKYHTGAPTTFQSQYATDYVKKRVSKGRKRVARRKYRTFKKMLYKQVGCQHFVFRHQARAASAENSQEWIDIPLYSCNGGKQANLPAADRFQHTVYMADQSERSTAGGGSNVTDKYGVVRSTFAQMDLQMTNRSANSVLVNVYYYYCKKDLCQEDANSDSITNVNDTTLLGLLEQGKNLEPNNKAIGHTTNLFFRDIGFTPFQSPRFCQYITIYKKQRFQLAPGQSITDILKDKKMKDWTFNTVDNLVYKKNFSSGMLINFHGMYDATPRFTETDPPQQLPSHYPPSTVDWSTQYTYNCKHLRFNNTDTSGYTYTLL